MNSTSNTVRLAPAATSKRLLFLYARTRAVIRPAAEEIILDAEVRIDGTVIAVSVTYGT